ncbi:MAG: phenylacetate--CoA ligase family protein [Chloroflexi bacterium]|nr:phenylacetate--CoA ligase family protein [Chloroflexota bacterium]
MLRELKFVRSIERRTPEELRRISNERLSRLLIHAWTNTDYYHELLSDCGVVRDGKVDLDRFEDVPFLTKRIIQQDAGRLRAGSLPKGRKAYVNRTGGSTGEPVEYWQDSHYEAVNVADKLYHFETMGKEPGQRELKIWGAERDIFRDTSGLKVKLKNFIYNRSVKPCGSLSTDDIQGIIEHINRTKPRLIWAYIDGAYAVASYAERNGLKLHSPAAVFCGGGTMFPDMEASIQRAFQAPAINFYGSREMGDVACECSEKQGLHVASHSHVVEVLDENARPVMEQEGELVITSLMNYAMPFIRYRIGDRGALTARRCACGRGFPLLDSVSGRSIESFVTASGNLVSPIYLITSIGAALNPGLVRKFQLVQDDYSHVTLNLVPESGHEEGELTSILRQVTEKIRGVMGQDCVVDHRFVRDIPRQKSGKYLYTISNVAGNGYSWRGGEGESRDVQEPATVVENVQ